MSRITTTSQPAPHDHAHHHAHDASCGCGHTRTADPDPAALVSVRGVAFKRNGRNILSGIDLDVMPGEIVTLIGPNGAGKTTLVKLILGIEIPDTGQISVPASTRVGYVPQRFEISRTMPMSVAGFLALGQPASKNTIAAVLKDVGAVRTANQQLSQLSGGETQRVLIARALLRNPNLLVLDEPARGVDYVGEADLYDLISRIRDERRLGVLLISHDLHVVMAKSDRVICLNGHVCCSGKPETVAQHAEYARLFGQQAARALGVYLHHHDHEHDISGAAHPVSGTSPLKRGV
jgi:zinc transport system ATP-binding protein